MWSNRKQKNSGRRSDRKVQSCINPRLMFKKSVYRTKNYQKKWLRKIKKTHQTRKNSTFKDLKLFFFYLYWLLFYALKCHWYQPEEWPVLRLLSVLLIKCSEAAGAQILRYQLCFCFPEPAATSRPFSGRFSWS